MHEYKLCSQRCGHVRHMCTGSKESGTKIKESNRAAYSSGKVPFPWSRVVWWTPPYSVSASEGLHRSPWPLTDPPGGWLQRHAQQWPRLSHLRFSEHGSVHITGCPGISQSAQCTSVDTQLSWSFMQECCALWFIFLWVWWVCLVLAFCVFNVAMYSLCCNCWVVFFCCPSNLGRCVWKRLVGVLAGLCV